MAVDHDALVKERQGMSREDAEIHYIASEMLDPLIGGKIIGARIIEDEYGGANPFPVLMIEDIHGDRVEVIISMDDEQNGGGRLILNYKEGK